MFDGRTEVARHERIDHEFRRSAVTTGEHPRLGHADTAIRGRIDFTQQLHRSPGRYLPLAVSYQSHDEDILENQLLAAAVKKLTDVQTYSTRTQRSLARLRRPFEGITAPPLRQAIYPRWVGPGSTSTTGQQSSSPNSSSPKQRPTSAPAKSRRHERVPADAPADGRRVLVRLRIHRMRCPVTECARQTFREQVPGLVERYQRRTVRLGEQIRAVVRELEDRASARLLPKVGIALGARHR
ncbi:5-methylcytosine restriction system specificity protein McrC [Amycolatopsis nalaikhensis]|uniref:Transposase n=1 Tax=Amycolatopsis nalaikhensis TaxID=715472 RepID=A0ABY8Y281_9PSEU|nr:hypothetical protein [Amycolatopsis sp. 2-2]WIV62152.1 hypothetical protein QP939_29100 [Amycolatopsis sp. 2-2]